MESKRKAATYGYSAYPYLTPKATEKYYSKRINKKVGKIEKKGGKVKYDPLIALYRTNTR